MNEPKKLPGNLGRFLHEALQGNVPKLMVPQSTNLTGLFKRSINPSKRPKGTGKK